MDGCTGDFSERNGSRAQEKKNESAKYAGKLLEQEQTQKRLSREIVDGNLKANDLAHQLDSLSKKLLDLEKQKNERLRIMKYVGMDEAHMDQKNLILGSAGRKDERAGHGKRQSDPEKSRSGETAPAAEGRKNDRASGKYQDLPGTERNRPGIRNGMAHEKRTDGGRECGACKEKSVYSVFCCDGAGGF